MLEKKKYITDIEMCVKRRKKFGTKKVPSISVTVVKNVLAYVTTIYHPFT
jgi:hypothetical protein